MIMGVTRDGRALSYDEHVLEFHLAHAPISLEDVRALDAAGAIRWKLLEQRDWVNHIDASEFERAHHQALLQMEPFSSGLSAEEQIQRHAAIDNGYLPGRVIGERTPEPQGSPASGDSQMVRVRPKGFPGLLYRLFGFEKNDVELGFTVVDSKSMVQEGASQPAAAKSSADSGTEGGAGTADAPPPGGASKRREASSDRR